jgi:hypothetical protein
MNLHAMDAAIYAEFHFFTNEYQNDQSACNCVSFRTKGLISGKRQISANYQVQAARSLGRSNGKISAKEARAVTSGGGYTQKHEDDRKAERKIPNANKPVNHKHSNANFTSHFLQISGTEKQALRDLATLCFRQFVFIYLPSVQNWRRANKHLLALSVRRVSPRRIQ